MLLSVPIRRSSPGWPGTVISAGFVGCTNCRGLPSWDFKTHLRRPAASACRAPSSCCHAALIAIYPNPLYPKKYVVLNSGFTFREADHASNARQVPKLPDWAIVDVRVPATPRAPGRIAAAGFFNEQWQLIR